MLVELDYVGQQTRRACYSPAIRSAVGRRIVVTLNDALRRLLPLEGELVLSKFCQGGRLLEEEPVNTVQHLAHKLIKLCIAELPRQELDGGCSVVLLDLGDLLLVLLCQVALQPPVLFAALITGELAEERSEPTDQTGPGADGCAWQTKNLAFGSTREGTTRYDSNICEECACKLRVELPVIDQVVEVFELNFRAALLQRSQIDAVISLLHPQVVQAYGFAGQFDILCGLEQVV